ncbi:MAG: hypothetical protein PVJ05_04275 [Candidatus Thorarchaeota archaeon]|jgi:hypothetical protein
MFKYDKLDHRNIPITLFLIGFTLLVIGSINVIQPDQFGSPWMLIPGTLLLISGIGAISLKRNTRSDVKNALESYNRVSLKQLASELNMNKKELSSTIVDLRNDGEILAIFDYSDNDVIIETRS